MIDNKTKYEISKMRKKLSNKNFYSWLKENKICPGCKNALSDDGFVKCSICRYNDRSYNKNRNRKDYHNDYYQKNKNFLKLPKHKIMTRNNGKSRLILEQDLRNYGKN